MIVKGYSDPALLAWEGLVARSSFATFLHSRKFLSYHGDRFHDVSLVIQDGESVIAVFPAAIDPVERSVVTSHPGSTYGGLVHDGELYGEDLVEAIRAIGRYYRKQGFARLRYKAVPYIYHKIPCADDLYALFRLGARRYRCDLSAAIDLQNRPTPSERRRRGLRRAAREGIYVTRGISALNAFWNVLEENLARRHRKKPVHSREEIEHLCKLFPNEIELVVGMVQSEVLGGVILFQSAMVTHAQYIASSETGNRASVLDYVFDHCICEATKKGKRYFDFGISNEQEGRLLNAGLYQFKREFGAGGVPHEFYELDLGDL